MILSKCSIDRQPHTKGLTEIREKGGGGGGLLGAGVYQKWGLTRP